MNHTKNKKTPQPTTTFYQKINIFLGKYTWYILGVSLVLFILFGILLFNPFINEAGDDTSYIEGAYAVLYQNTFPSFQGSLYPFVLSILILAFGVDVVILKAFSLICLTLSVGLLFRSLHKHVDPVLNIFVLLMSTFSGAILFYGSQTFNEAFYMMVQSISCLLFIKYYAGEDSEQNKWSKKISIALWVTLWIFLAGITKTVGIVFLPAAIITLLLFRRWKDSILTFSAFALYYLIFAGIKNLVWGIDFLKSDNSQAHALMQKNPYNAGDGMEDFSGYLTRLVENANLFISKYFYNFSHLRENTEAVQPLALLTIFTIVIWIFSLYQGVVKKNKTIVFLALYAGFFMGVTFVALQTFWRQDRLLLPVFPIILLLFWHAIKELTKFEKRWYSAITGLIVMMALIFISFTDVVKKTQEPKFRKHQKAYFKGNRVSSYTNDWKNFLLMSEWSANNTPDTVKIASRKGSMSNIFSGKFKFYGIYAVPPIKIDSIHPPHDTLIPVIMIPQAVNSYTPQFTKYLEVIFHANENMPFEGGPQMLLGLYYLPKSHSSDFEKLKSINFPYEANAFQWIDANAKKDGISIYSPDILYSKLKDNNVHYVLMANLRLNPLNPSAGIVSTVNRYMYYVSCKYPNIMGTSIQTIGITEPADLHPLSFNN